MYTNARCDPGRVTLCELVEGILEDGMGLGGRRDVTTGHVRGGLFTAIYSQALSLLPRARVQMTNDRLVNHISTDVSCIDYCLGYFHMSWTILIQFIICLILLLINLGPSALAGFALLIVGTPINAMMMKRLFSIRIKSIAWTDKRSKLLQEMLSGIRVVEFFSWEIPFLKRIAEYRDRKAHV